MKQVLNVKGMHCRSCEVALEESLTELKGVRKVFASTKKGQVTVYGDGFVKDDIITAIKKAGYSIGQEDLPWINLNRAYLKDFTIALVLFLSLYLFGKALGVEKILTPGSSATSSLLVVFTIGLTAGLSTCMALVGGLVLGISARYSEKHPTATPLQKFRPHIFFNLGRVISYFVLGGAIGLFGSVFRLSNALLGVLTIIIGVVMVGLGIQLLEVFPKFSNRFTLPKFLAKWFRIKDRTNKEYSNFNAAILGGLTFFLPCGFTQAMQVYAITTGSFLRAALIMSVFAIGTTPGLLGVGGLTAYLGKGKYAGLFFKFIGLVVIAMAIFNITSGYNLTGFILNLQKENPATEGGDTWRIISAPKTSSDPQNGAVNPELQIIKAVYDTSSILTPKEFTVSVGKPVRFEVLAKEDGEGCMGSIMIPGLAGEPQFFQKDQTVTFEFTPKRTGKFRITCAMGLQAGIINVR